MDSLVRIRAKTPLRVSFGAVTTEFAFEAEGLQTWRKDGPSAG